MHIEQIPSPNHDSRCGERPSLVILHYTAMSGDAARERLCDPVAEVSSHYLIGEQGDVHQLVDEAERAWHAGVAYWAGRAQVNARSIGIELVHLGHETPDVAYPELQMRALENLLGDILRRWVIPPEGVLGHSDVAPSRKRDPGEWFPWPRLAAAGLAVWKEGGRSEQIGTVDGGLILQLQVALADIGYDVDQSGWLDSKTRSACCAFQRRFRPAEVGLPVCATMLDHAEEVARLWPGVRH